MNQNEIEQLIDQKIRQHESRVGWISGIIGLFFLFGNFHAFWLMRLWMN
jgi:ABC-type nickel/cobalt efflux system permease component RcnA